MRLISFLGLGESQRTPDGKPTGEYIYRDTTYRFHQDDSTDVENCCYIARAIAQSYVVEEPVRGKEPVTHSVESVYLLATEQAENAHLSKILADFESNDLPFPNIIRVPHGANSAQQWEQFNAILQAIPSSSEEKVILDITHGFRSQPFFAAAVINYIRAIRNPEDVPEMRVLYGEYNAERRISDVWDMTTFITLLDWSNSMQSFMKTGHGASLAKLAREENRNIQRSVKENRPITLDKLATSIRVFSENISTVRVIDIITGKVSQGGSAANVLACIENSTDEVKQYFPPLFPIFMELKDKLAGIPASSLFDSEGQKAMLQLAKLYVDYERFPEAAIVLREGWVSLYADDGKIDQDLLSSRERKTAEDKWYEAEGRSSKSGYADLLSGVRNDIQHGGFRSNPSSADKLIQNIDSLIDAFAKRLDDLPLVDYSTEELKEELNYFSSSSSAVEVDTKGESKQ